ncbi:hypothetical protein SUGI_0290080 [Cryptomeria japonica]|nr:hypothetical protein SUGI_0290080 [Cryptomeria japonica]
MKGHKVMRADVLYGHTVCWHDCFSGRSFLLLYLYSKMRDKSLGKVKEAYRVLDAGIEAGLFPCKCTLTFLLSALCIAGKLDNVYKFFVT